MMSQHLGWFRLRLLFLIFSLPVDFGNEDTWDVLRAYSQGRDIPQPNPGELSAAQGLVFVDEGLCFRPSPAPSILRRVVLRAGALEPLEGLSLLLLHPVGNGYEVVYRTPEFPSAASGEVFALLNNATGNERTTPSWEKSLDPAGLVTFVFSDLHGRPGDCLGWYHRPHGQGSVACETDRSGQVRQWVPDVASKTPSVGVRLTPFGLPLGRSCAVRWFVVPPASALVPVPRPLRLELLDRTVEVAGLIPASTSPQFKRDLVVLFADERWAAEAVIEVGACGGATSSILSHLFGLVYAVEIHVQLDASRRGRAAGLRNVVHLGLDTGKPYIYSALASNDIKAAVIDGDHDAQHVFFDTFGVLHDVPCCVEIIVYHDYCDQVVYDTVQFFVKTGVLRFIRGFGMPAWEKWWCKDGRHEGGVFEVIRDDLLPNRLEMARRQFKREDSNKELVSKLNGSSWTLHADLDIGIMDLRLSPMLAKLRLHKSHHALDMGVAKIHGWQLGLAPTRWAPSGSLLVRLENRAGSAILVFDRELLGFTMSTMDPAKPLIAGLPDVLVGTRRGNANTWIATEPVYAKTSLG